MNPTKQIAKSLIPPKYHDVVRLYGYRALNFGGNAYCACCDSRVRTFKSFGATPRPNARCPVCGALERDRLVSLFLRKRRDMLVNAQNVLHVAPESPIERILRSEADAYVSFDLGEQDAMMQADLTEMPFPERTFDGVYCSHVLEHIPDDIQALSEMRRVLNPGGWAMIQVPVTRQETIEDPTIEDPALRRELFGQEDHVRIYGTDFRDRLEDVGFAVSVERPYRGMTPEMMARLGVNDRQDIYLCRRPD